MAITLERVLRFATVGLLAVSAAQVMAAQPMPTRANFGQSAGANSGHAPTLRVVSMAAVDDADDSDEPNVSSLNSILDGNATQGPLSLPAPDDPASANGKSSTSSVVKPSSAKPILAPGSLVSVPDEDDEDEDQVDDDYYPFEPPACASSSGTWLNRGTWYSQDQVTYLTRSAGHKTRVLAREIANASTTPVLVREFRIEDNLGWEPGARLTLGRFVGRDDKNRDSAIEFTYLGLNHWFEDRGIIAIGSNIIETGISPVAGVGGFNNAAQQSFKYRSDFDSYELTYRLGRRLGRDQLVLDPDGHWVRECSPAPLPSIFGGLRVVTVNESLGYFSQGPDPATRLGRYLVDTHNGLVGMQIGTDVFYEHCAWQLGVRVKGGPFIDFADQSSNVKIIDTISPPDRNEHARRDVLAFAGEVNLTSAYRFRPNMALRASCDLIWINQVALASEQLTFAPVTQPLVTTGAGLFYQGGSLGFEFVW